MGTPWRKRKYIPNENEIRLCLAAVRPGCWSYSCLEGPTLALRGQNSTLVQETLEPASILQPGLSKCLVAHRPPPALASHQTAAHRLLWLTKGVFIHPEQG